jgi:hypothetical protein
MRAAVRSHGGESQMQAACSWMQDGGPPPASAIFTLAYAFADLHLRRPATASEQ